MIPMYEIASQYDIARFLHDAILYNNHELSEAQLLHLVQEQVRLGEQNAVRLELYGQDTVNQTAFATKLNRLKEKYAVFTPDDCIILPAVL